MTSSENLQNLTKKERKRRRSLKKKGRKEERAKKLKEKQKKRLKCETRIIDIRRITKRKSM